MRLWVHPTRQSHHACIYFLGKRHLLGEWGSLDADAAYRLKVRELLNVVHTGEITAQTRRRVEVEVTHVAHLAEAFDLHAKDYYIKRGERTGSATRAATVRRLLGESGFDRTPLREADACWLRDFRTWICKHKAADGELNRTTVNIYAAIVVQMFRFGASNGICDASSWEGLKALEPIKKRRAPAAGLKPLREGEKREPVPRHWIRIVRPHMSRTIRMMMDLELLTGMRPQEICALRGEDLHPTRLPGVLLYRVTFDRNKTDHVEHGEERRVWIGPRGCKLLMLAGKGRIPSGYVFRPADALEDRFSAAAAGRKTPKWPSHDVSVRRARRRSRGVTPAMLGEMYTPASYRRAMERACARAIKAQKKRTKEMGVELKPSERAGRFTPYQLRHNAASEICNREELSLAKELLGHRDIRTTIGYVKVSDRRAAAAALKYG